MQGAPRELMPWAAPAHCQRQSSSASDAASTQYYRPYAGYPHTGRCLWCSATLQCSPRQPTRLDKIKNLRAQVQVGVRLAMPDTRLGGRLRWTSFPTCSATCAGPLPIRRALNSCVCSPQSWCWLAISPQPPLQQLRLRLRLRPCPRQPQHPHLRRRPLPSRHDIGATFRDYPTTLSALQ